MTVESWTTESVVNCLVPVSVAGKTKVQARDYKSTGRFPVIDQGQEQIAGWTDDESAVVESPLPLVVFGDHTRTFKFLDVPFARGADGTQLLRSKPGIDPLFFFYACRAIDLPARGYNRHFTILKEKELSYPVADNEQKAIAAVLRQTESALAQQSALLKTLHELKRAAMTRLFTLGLRGEAQKETEIGPVPQSWEVAPFDVALKIAEGQVDPKIEPYASMFHIGPENVESHNGHLLPCQPAKDLALISGKYFFERGDIVYSKIRPYLNKVVMPDFSGICSADMYPLRARAGFDARFLFHYLLSEFFLRQAVPHQLRTGIPKINREQLADTAFPKPATLDEQRDIAVILDALDRKSSLHRQKRAVLEELFQSLLHKLMTSEIHVTDLDLSALPTAEGQAAGALA